MEEVITVFLVGKTKKGRERVRQHGKIWTVIERLSHKILLQSPHKSMSGGVYDLRWVDLPFDTDFHIQGEQQTND